MFRAFIRSDGPGCCTFRFMCERGGGSLGLRLPGREDPAPVEVDQVERVPLAALRAGRFVHVQANGTRRSYSLAQLAAPGEVWVELEATVQLGFRGLVNSSRVSESSRLPAGLSVPQPADEASLLRRRVTDLEDALAAAREREAELLELLGRWRERGGA
jgi:hypothetical protein